MNEPELNEFQKAYNQGVEDCKKAIRNVGDDNWEGAEFTPFFINEIARKCSPYCYRHVPSSKEDIQLAREILDELPVDYIGTGTSSGAAAEEQAAINLVVAALVTARQRGIEAAIHLVEEARASTTHARTRVLYVWLMAELRALSPSPVLGAHPEDYCHRCFCPNIVWYAPNEIWNKAVREQGHPEILCPVCFVALAEIAGIDTVWEVRPGKPRTSDSWQPIETAPKDGQFILLGRKQPWSSSFNTCLAYWADSHQCDFPGWMTDSGRSVDTAIYCYWMPLPLPPIMPHEHIFKAWTGTENVLCWCGAVQKKAEKTVRIGVESKPQTGINQ